MTGLISAAQPCIWLAGLPTVIEQMLQAEANVHAADAEGDLPLHVAAACGSVTSVRLWLAASARVGAENLRLETT